MFFSSSPFVVMRGGEGRGDGGRGGEEWGEGRGGEGRGGEERREGQGAGAGLEGRGRVYRG